MNVVISQNINYYLSKIYKDDFYTNKFMEKEGEDLFSHISNMRIKILDRNFGAFEDRAEMVRFLDKILLYIYKRKYSKTIRIEIY
jgi:hypothetical protein